MMKSLILLLFLPASIAISSSLTKIEDETSTTIVPVKHITDISINTNSNIITSSFEDQMDKENDFLDEEDDALLMNDDNIYDNIDDVQHNHDGQQPYFEIRSMIHFFSTSSNHDGWCLQEAFQSKKKNLITATVCDGSASQKWLLDDRGHLHNQKYPNKKCLKKAGKSFKVDDCSTTVTSKLKWMKWIVSSDGTIRWGNNALLAIAIPEKYTSSNMLNRKVAPVTLMKLANRFPKVNEQWMPVFPEPETLAPSPNPTAQPTIRTTVYPTPSMTMFPTPNFDKPPHNNPGNETSDAPFMSPTFPTPSHTSFPSPDFDKPPHGGNFPTPTNPSPTGLFNISLMNMGSINIYDEQFQKAKAKLEKIIIGDIPDHMGMSHPDHDWFGSFWPDHDKVNIFVDDVLIGYEIGEIDGRSKILGFAGPRYIRPGSISITTISGIMKFDEVDFREMSNEDISLVVLHEMVHVLGIGTLWSNYRCGLTCSGSNTTHEQYYECNGATNEYAKLLYDPNAKIPLSTPDCGHWSESSFWRNDASEIMTPYFEANKYQPLSRVSVASLADLGYEVNMSAADPIILFDGDNEGEGEEEGEFISSFKMMRTNKKKTNIKKLMQDANVTKPSTTFSLDGSRIITPKIEFIGVE